MHSRQTADTLQAAATFLDLCQIWGPLEPETASKIKFAKYHALRIAKAIKAGEDPNLSNPAPEPMPNDETTALDPNDLDVQMLNGPPTTTQSQGQAYQPSVEEVPDEHDRLERQLAHRSLANESIHPLEAPSNPDLQYQNTWNQPGEPSPQAAGENYYNNGAGGEVSPLAPPEINRTTPAGGGYFPQVLDTHGSSHLSALPDAQPREPWAPPTGELLDLPTFPPASSSASDQRPSYLPHTDSLESFPPPPMDQNIEPNTPQAPVPHYPPQHQPAPRQMSARPSTSTQPRPAVWQSSNVTQSGPHRPNVPEPPSSNTDYVANEEAVLKAQKHARWAISALNFEDVNTAVKELRVALEALGAR